MKKLMVLAAVAALAFTASAAKLDPKTSTEADYMAALQEMLATTNNADIWSIGVTNNFWQAAAWMRYPAVRAVADEAFAARGYAPADWWRFFYSLPKVSALARAKNGADVAYARSIEIAARLASDIGAQAFVRKGGTLADIAVVLSEEAAFPNVPGGFVCYVVDSAKQAIQKLAVKAVKKHLRSQGKSFVTKNGVNPCEGYMTALNTALNAPRFAGLEAWFAEMGIEGLDLSKMPSEAVVAQLREDVLVGEKDMTERNKAILYVCLGVDGYNAFVKEYNGEK